MTSRLPSLAVAAPRAAAALLALAALLAAAFPAPAGVVTAYAGASGPGLGSVVFDAVTTPAMGNDNVAGISPNAIAIQLMTFDETEIIDLVFVVEEFGLPTTEYQVTETVLNNSGEDWIGFALELGFGTGAGFVPSAMGDDLDFDAPDFDSPLDIPPFANITFDENYIDTFDGFILDGGSQTFTFALDVPVGVTEFTIRHRGRALPVPEASPTWGEVKTLFR